MLFQHIHFNHMRQMGHERLIYFFENRSKKQLDFMLKNIREFRMRIDLNRQEKQDLLTILSYFEARYSSLKGSR